MLVISFKISNFLQNVHPDRKLGCFNIARRCPVSWLLMAGSGHWGLVLRNVICVVSSQIVRVPHIHNHFNHIAH